MKFRFAWLLALLAGFAASFAEFGLLLEDFGDRSYTRLLADGGDEAALYRLAVDVLIALHLRFQPALGASVPPYDEGRLLTEASLSPPNESIASS